MKGRIGLAAFKLQDFKIAVEARSLALKKALQRFLVEFVARSNGCECGCVGHAWFLPPKRHGMTRMRAGPGA